MSDEKRRQQEVAEEALDKAMDRLDLAERWLEDRNGRRDRARARAKSAAPYIVGESKPELFIPAADGVVLPQVPNDELLPVERAVKFTGPDTIEGLAMPYGVDTDGEQFTPNTDFCFDWYGKSGRPFLFEHGLDDDLKTVKIGTQVDYEARDEGIWAKVQLDRNRRYRKAVDQLIEEGAFGYSSGAMQHLAQKNRRGEITVWPWVELSGTPIPSHPATLGIHYVKSADFLARLETDEPIPAPLKAALAALDEWAESRDDESLPDGLKFAEHADRLLADVEAFRSRTGSLVGLRAKAGRVLSAQTRERLLRHPASLRELADDLDDLLSAADAEKAAKSADPLALFLDYERTLARLNGVELPAEGATP